MRAKIVLLGGDGIGTEVVAEARRVLDAVAARSGHAFSYDQQLIGGAAIDATGAPLPEATLAAARAADAVLLGAVGERTPRRPAGDRGVHRVDAQGARWRQA